ncbi:MAG: AAA family ATPase [Planctomycetota bacterium]
MRLRALSVRVLAGIDTPFELDELGAALTVIHGPNGSGKSSIVRAVRALLWPREAKDNTYCELAARFVDGEHEYFVERRGPNIFWQREGRVCDPPPLPTIHESYCFTIAVEALRDTSAEDTELSAALARELAGGYDEAALLQRAPYLVGSRFGQLEANALSESLREREQLRNKQAALKAQESVLDDERTRLQLAGEAAADVRRLERLRDWHDEQAKIDRTSAVIATMPEPLRHLHGDEVTRLEPLKRRRVEAREALRDCERAHSRAAAEIAMLELKAPLPPGLLESWSARERQLESEEREARQLEQELARLRGTAALTSDNTMAPTLAGPSSELASALAAHVKHAEELLRDRAQIDVELARIDALRKNGEIAEASHPERGATLLRRWLSAPVDARRALWIASGISAAMTLGLAFSIAMSPTVTAWQWWALGAAIPPLAMLWWVAQHAAWKARADARTEFCTLPLAAPSDWGPEAVTRRLVELDDEVSAARAVALRAERRDTLLAQRVHLDAKDREHRAAGAALASRLGLEAPANPLSLWATGHELLRRADDAATFRGRESEHAHARSRVAALVAALARELTEWLPSPLADDAHAVRQALKRLAAADATVRAAAELAREAARQLDEARRLLANIEISIADIYRGVAIAVDDEALLSELCERRPAYQQLVEEQRGAENRAAALRAELEAQPTLFELSRADTELALERARATALKREELLKSITLLENQLEAARSGHTLEDALADVAACRHALDDRFGAALFSGAATWLVKEAAAEQRARNEPSVLKQAADWFALFTRYRYELVSDRAPSASQRLEFRAREAPSGRGIALGELSTGTRAQLLLAVRLAHAVGRERGVEVPFFLDEVLASSDPERRAAIVESLFELASESHRQFFYLSCQPAEVEAFRALAARRAPDLVQCIDLGALRGRLAMAPDGAALRAIELPHAPAPMVGEAPESYARRISVPALAMERGAAALHLFYLFTDELALLYRLLSQRLESVGQLELLLRSESARTSFTAAEREQLAVRVAVAHAAADAWQIGRSRRCDADFFIDAGVSETFLEQILRVASELNWNTAAVLTEIERLPRFQKKRLEHLRDLATARGLIDSRPPLDAEHFARYIGDCLVPHVGAGRTTAAQVATLAAEWWSRLGSTEPVAAAV